MSWLKLSLDASAEQLAHTEQTLTQLGAQALTVLPLDDALPWEPAPGQVPIAPRNRVEALIPLTLGFEGLHSSLGQQLSGAQMRSLDATFVGAADSQQRALAGAVTEQFAGKLWLLPKAAPARPGATVRLDPGLAFGTGGHPTTRLCLQALARSELGGTQLLDYGCGSGILAIAALALGAAAATAVDYDVQALVATAGNASYNGIRCVTEHGLDGSAAGQSDPQPKDAAQHLTRDPSKQEGTSLRICLPEQLDATARFDVVVANILANPLIELAPRLQAALRSGGQLLLAGLLAEQAQRVAAAYEQIDFVMHTPAHSDGSWRLLQGVRR